MKYADLHIHSNCSDGTLSPRDVVAAAHQAHLSVIAVADHDSVAGIPEALEAAKAYSLEVIPALELTAEVGGAEIHILGFYIDFWNQRFRKKLVFLQKNRVMRVHRIVKKLRGQAVHLSAKDVFAIAGEGTVGRLHIARAMVRGGWVSSQKEAFGRYIGDHCPSYELGFRFSLGEAIALIKSVGGIPVLAHPYSIRKKDIIAECIREGIMGLEVYYPEHTASMIKTYLSLAEAHGLLVTGGSDFHGGAKPEVKLGAVKLAYRYVRALAAARNGTGAGA
jgi:3',5'-nucleoside bisphosphate phosphatase